MLTAIEEFKAQAENFSAALINFSQNSEHQEGNTVYFDDPTTSTVETIAVGKSTAQPDVDFRTLQTLAGDIFNFAVDLLNMQEKDRYLLGGAETLEKPITSTGTLDEAISTLLGDWKTGAITTTGLIADLQDRTTANGNNNALTDTVIGYNAQLSNGNVGDIFIRISDVSEIEYTVLANEKPFRDILVALSYFKSEALPPLADEVEIDPTTGLPVILTEGAPGDTLGEMQENFYEVFNQLTAMVNTAMDDIDQLRNKLENARARMDGIKQDYANQKNLLLDVVSQVEDVDINEVALKISTMQIQLEASYRVTALVSEMSLVNFISPF